MGRPGCASFFVCKGTMADIPGYEKNLQKTARSSILPVSSQAQYRGAGTPIAGGRQIAKNFLKERI